MCFPLHKRPLLFSCLALWLVGGAGAARAQEDAAPPRVRLEHGAMGTTFEAIIYGPSPLSDPEELRGYALEAFAAIDALEQQISTWREDSATSRLNRAAAAGPVKAPSSLMKLLEDAKTLYEDTEGAFDVTVGPLIEIWGNYAKQPRDPSPEELAAALEKTGLDKVQLSVMAGTVRFAHEGMRLDFGGIGKGLALDRAAGVLRARGITSALLHGGASSIVALGAPPGKEAWTIHLGPFDDRYPQVENVAIRDESLSSSSAYARPLEGREGKRSHIFDPRTGHPVEGLLGSTAIAPLGVTSDALSTAFYVMGRGKVEAYCRAHPEVRAILVLDEGGAPKPIRINFKEKQEEEP